MNNKKIKNELTIIIGKRIAEIRKNLNLTQEDVEEKSMVNGEKTIKYKTLSLIEQGYGEPKITTINLIAQALGTTLSNLLDIRMLNNEATTNHDIINDIVEILKTFDETKLKIILKQVEAIKDL